MKKQTIKLNEAQLQRVIKESVKRVLREDESIVDYDDELRNDYDEWETQNEMWVDYVSEHLDDFNFALRQAESLYEKMRKSDGGKGVNALHLDDTKNTAMLHLIGGLKSAIANMHRLAGHTGSAY